VVRVARTFIEADTVAMPAESTSQVITAEELERIEIPGKVTELLRGRPVVREPPGARHGGVAAKLTYLLGEHVYRNHLGVLFAQDTGFKIESSPDTVRAPDVAFVAQMRADRIPARGYAQLAPDLAVEIVSPDDRPGELLAKVGQWLDAGTKLVWVIDPVREEARVYRSNGELTIVPRSGTLDGEDVIPGLACALIEVLR
jgi:Uma2 family endonuclease